MRLHRIRFLELLMAAWIVGGLSAGESLLEVVLPGSVTEDALGMAKDELAAKPLVLYEADDIVALASEEIAIRAVVDREIDTYDPFEGEVMVWAR